MIPDSHNGAASSHAGSGRRFRIDDLTAIVVRNTPGGSQARTRLLEEGHSGRLFVLAAGVTLLLVWGILYVCFREWRAGYRARALYGKTQVISTIDPMRVLLPPKVDADAWRSAVDETRAMLLTLVDSNLLDLRAMDALRLELVQHVHRASAQPAVAVTELAEIWNETADRGEFLFRDSRSASGRRHPRPAIIPSYAATRVVPVLDALNSIAPPGVDSGAWHEAIDETRSMVISVSEAHSFDVATLRKLRERLSQRVERVGERAESALDEMTAIWSELAGPASDRYPRPKLLATRHAESSQNHTETPVR